MPGYIIRHGEIPDNVKHLMRDPKSNPSLDANGVKQATDAANALKGKTLTSIRASDKRRTVQTANIISKIVKVPVQLTKNLETFDVGDWAHVPEDKAYPAIRNAVINNTKPPNGEFPKDWIKKTWVEIRQFLNEVKDGFHPIIISHGMTIGLFRAAIEGNGEHFNAESINKMPIEKHGKVYPVTWDGSKFKIGDAL